MTELAALGGRGGSGNDYPWGEYLRECTSHVLQTHWNRSRKAVPDLPTGFRFHDLRHTANTIAAGTGASLKDLMYRMGHASPQAALRYQHATRERDQFIADAVDGIVVAARG
jgi:integrase